jgi:hypothetical protein
MSFHGLEARFVPIVAWPGPPTRDRKRGPFRATVGQTVSLLKRELAHLGARNIVIQLDGDESQIRRDGYPRADGCFRPGVIVTFDSRHGPLSYPCDTYAYWDQNLRAIALALEALRAVDRYGVTRRGEQYTGWKKLPPGGAITTTMPVEEAARFMVKVVNPHAPDDVLVMRVREILAGGREAVTQWYHAAAKELHPDRPGGSTERMATLNRAKQALEAFHNGNGKRSQG